MLLMICIKVIQLKHLNKCCYIAGKSVLVSFYNREVTIAGSMVGFLHTCGPRHQFIFK